MSGLRRQGRGALALVGALALAVGVLAACGEEEDDSGAASDLASLVPADVPLYAQAVLRPEGDQRDEVDSALGTLLQTDDPGGMIVDALDEELAEDEVTYEEDIEPWLGKRLAAFATSSGSGTPDFAVIVETTDAEAAIETIRSDLEDDPGEVEERSYEGTEYLVAFGPEQEYPQATGIVGEHVVSGTVAGFEAVVDAAAGESLADSGGLGEEFDEVADGLLAFYADPRGFVDLIAASGEVPAGEVEAFERQLGVAAEGPVVGGIDATADSFTLEFSSATPEGSTTASGLFEDLPADSWVAIAAGNLAAATGQAIAGFDAQLGATPFAPPELRGGLEAALRRELGVDLERDILSWMGDVAAYARGTSIFSLAGAVVVETDDEQATIDVLDRLRGVLEREPAVEIAPLGIEGEGFELRFPGAPVQVPIVVRDGKLIAGLGEASVEEALEPDEPLGDSDAYDAATEALGDDLDPIFLLDFEPIVELIESTGAANDDPDYTEAKPYLDALHYIAAGQREDSGRTTIRLVLGVDEGEE